MVTDKLELIFKEQNIDELNKYIANGGDISKIHLSTILDYILIDNSINKDFIQELLKNNIQITAGEEISALMIASHLGIVEIIQPLIDNGSDINEVYDDKWTPLISASLSESNKLETMQILLDNGANLNYLSAKSINVLENAVRNQDIEVVKLLINNGADVNMKNKNGRMALFYASYENNEKIVKLLIENGADINATSEHENNALFYAAKFGKNKMAKLLINNGANTNIKDNYGWTALFYATYNNNQKIVKLLIDNGADIDIKGEDGKTALLDAIDINSIEIVKLLIENGADVNIQDTYNWTALTYALFNNKLDIAQLLIDNGANINFKNKHSNTILMQFSLDKDYLRDLISNSNLNSELKAIKLANIDNDYNHINIKLIKFLIDNGVDINERNNAGLNAYNIAEIMNNTKLMKILYDNKADTSTHNKILYFIDNVFFLLLILLYIPIDILVEGKSVDLKIIFNYNKYFRKFRKLEGGMFPLLHKRKAKTKTMYQLYSELLSDIISLPKVLFNIPKNILNFFKPSEKNYKIITKYSPISDIIKDNENIDILEEAIVARPNDLNIKDNKGKTPLSYAVRNNDIKRVKLLLKHGASIDRINNDGKSIIQETEDKSIKRLLLDSVNIETHTPQALVKLLKNFTIDKPIKYTTHTWDFGELKKTYTDFNGYMEAVKKQFDSMKDELKELSPNLYQKIYTFLIDTNPNANAKYSWCGKTDINIGWSSLDGLEQWCNDGKNPFDFELKNQFTIDNQDITLFGEVINLFKQEIEIRRDFKTLHNIFANINLGRGFKKDIAKLDKQFYGDVQYFVLALDKIFTEIKKRQEFKDISIFTEEVDDNIISLKIIQKGSFSNQTADELLREIENGDFADIKHYLSNICDWSIENISNEESYRVNYLTSTNIKDIEKLENKIDGFTHILRFYK